MTKLEITKKFITLFGTEKQKKLNREYGRMFANIKEDFEATGKVFVYQTTIDRANEFFNSVIILANEDVEFCLTHTGKFGKKEKAILEKARAFLNKKQ